MKPLTHILRSNGIYYASIAVTFGLSWVLGQFTVAHLASTDISPPLNLLYIALPLLPILAVIPLIALRLQYKIGAKRFRRKIYVFLGVCFFAAYSLAAVLALFQQGLSVDRISVLAMLITLPIGFTLAITLDSSRFDEFHGAVLTRTAIYSIALTLFFTTAWGFLEIFAAVPDFPLFLIIPVFFGLFGLVHYFAHRRFS